MAYRFKLDERIRDAQVRTAGEQFDHALKCLHDDDLAAGVHGARKCIKRLRALLRLVRPGLAKSDYQRLNTLLRDAGRAISATRDRDVMIATISELASQSAQLGSALQPMTRRLSGKEDDTTSPFVTRKARKLLRKAQETWQGTTLKSDDMSQLTKALERGVKDMRKASAATANGDEEAFHELRKTVQRHWRHMRLLESGEPDYFGARAEEAKTISGLLGRAQDLSLVLRHMREQNGEESDETRDAETEMRRQRDELYADALSHTKKLLSEGPKAHARRALAHWAAARKKLGKKVRKNGPSAAAPVAAPVTAAAKSPRKRSPARRATPAKQAKPRRGSRSPRA